MTLEKVKIIMSKIYETQFELWRHSLYDLPKKEDWVKEEVDIFIKNNPELFKELTEITELGYNSIVSSSVVKLKY